MTPAESIVAAQQRWPGISVDTSALAQLMLGRTLAEIGFEESIVPESFHVKAPVFPFTAIGVADHFVEWRQARTAPTP